MKKPISVAAVTSTLLAVLAGCAAPSAPRKVAAIPAVEDVPPGRVEALPDMLARADAAFAEKYREERLREAVDLYRAYLIDTPGDCRAISKLTEALYFLADTYTGDPEEKKALHFEGRERGMDCLRQNPGFAGALRVNANDLQAAVKRLGKKEVPALFWTASNWGRWGELKGVLTVALDIPKVRILVERVGQLDQRYYGGGPHRFLGAYYASIPTFAGKSREKSRHHFERAISIAPDYLENRLLFARYYAVDAQDRALFERELKAVIETPPDEDSPYHLPNERAREEAARWLSRVDELFE